MAALARRLETGPDFVPSRNAEEGPSLDLRAFSSLASREEAEYLLALDHMKMEFEAEWCAFLVERFVGFLIWEQAPSGQITESDLDWLMGLMGDAPSPSTPAILFALVRELNSAPERLMALAMRHGRNRCPMPPSAMV